MRRTAGSRVADVAVLVRSNGDAAQFLRSFNLRGIPWTFSGNAGLYGRPEVRLLLAFLRAVAHPDDSVSLFYLAASDAYRVPGPELLRARVAERVAAMAEAGLVEEVRRLAERPLSRTARQALGYKELLDAMERGTPVEAALEAVVRRTRAYARRQLAWFRRDPRVRWSTLPPGPERVAWALEAYGKG